LTQTIVQEKPSFRRVLSNRQFTLLWSGQLVSQSGDFIFDVAAIWLVYQLTGNVFNVGLAFAMVLLPPIIVGPIAGVYVDKFNRKDLIQAGNVFQAFISAAIAVLYSTGRLSFPILLAFLFVLNAGAQFIRPAVTAVIPGVTKREDLATANSLFSLSSSVNQIAGYGIGGLLVLAFGATLPIYYDSFTFVFAAFVVSFIARSYCAVPTNPQNSLLIQHDSFLDRFRQGLEYIRKSRFFIELVIIGIVLNFFGSGVFALLAPYSKVVAGGGAGLYGGLLAGFSTGTVIGSVLVGKIDSRKYVGKLLFSGVIVIGGLTALMGLTSFALFALAETLAIGFFQATVNIPLSVLFQAKVPNELLGRVATSLVALITIAQPVSAATSGAVAGSISIGETFQLYGVLMMIVSAGAFFLFRELREAKY
jgi:MFS family permease